MPLWPSCLCPCFICGQPPGKSSYPRCFQGKKHPVPAPRRATCSSKHETCLAACSGKLLPPPNKYGNNLPPPDKQALQERSTPVCNLAIPSPTWQPPAHFPKPHMQGTKPEAEPDHHARALSQSPARAPSSAQPLIISPASTGKTFPQIMQSAISPSPRADRRE